MKLKNEQEIKALAKKYAQFCRDNGHSVNGIAEAYCVADFTKGYTQAQQDLLASASESFEEWVIKRGIKGDWTTEINKETWQAAILSQAKESEKLQKENEELRADLLYFWTWVVKGYESRPETRLNVELIKMEERYEWLKGEKK